MPEGYITCVSVQALWHADMMIEVELTYRPPDRGLDGMTITRFAGAPRRFSEAMELLETWQADTELVEESDIIDVLNDRHTGVDEP